MRVSVRDTTALAVGSTVSGLLAYLFFALSTRSLGAAEAAPVSVLWTYWSFSAAALTFPLQHWIARTVAANAGEDAVRRTMPAVTAVVVSVSALAGVVAWIVRDALFGRGDAWFLVLVGLVTLGSALLGVLRGSLSARHRFVAVAWALVLENGLRCAAAAAVIVAFDESAAGLGICLAAGALVFLLWPSAFVLRRSGRAHTAGSPLLFLSGASGAQLMGQAVLTGGPVLLALSGGSAVQVTALFACLALFRAPYTLAIGLVSQVTARITVLFVGGRHRELSRVRLVVLTGGVLGCAAAGAIGAVAGPALLRIIFGDGVRMTAGLSALVATGNAAALASLVITVMIMAQGRSVAVARAWGIAVLGAALVFALVSAEPLERTCWTFLAAEILAFLVLAADELRGSTRHAAARDVPAGGAPAAAD